MIALEILLLKVFTYNKFLNHISINLFKEKKE